MILGWTRKKAVVAVAGGKAAVRAMPWVVSLAAHVAVAAILSITGLVIYRSAADTQTIIPDARLSDTPGGRTLSSGDEEAPEGLAGQVTAAGPAVETAEPELALAGILGIGAAVGGEGEGDGDTQLIGLGGGAPMALTGLAAPVPAPAAGPVTKFFGTGGNAHHIVYLVDWSGSMFAEGRYETVQLELLRSLGDLQGSQDFHILFFSQGAPTEVPPARLVAAGDAERAAAGRFMRDKLGPPSSSARGPVMGTDPTPALRRAFEALRHPPTSRPGKLIYLLTDGDFSDNKAVLAELARLNRGRDVHINTILYATSLELSSTSTAPDILKAIATAHGGTYRWVKVDE